MITTDRSRRANKELQSIFDAELIDLITKELRQQVQKENGGTEDSVMSINGGHELQHCPLSSFIPLTHFFDFGLVGVSKKVIPKLREMNELQPPEIKLEEEHILALTQIMSLEDYSVESIHIAALEIGLQWSLETIVPLLDAFRIALLNSRLNQEFCFVEVLFLY